MSIRQCPQCELRFPTKSELEFHCTLDHPSEKAPGKDEGLGDDHGRDRVRGSTGEGSR